MTTEIPQKFWTAFCNQLREWYRGAVSIRETQPDGETRTIIENVPLQTVAFEKQDNSCNDLMKIEAGAPDERPLQHQIVEPIRVVLKQNDESGRFNEVEILAENGTTAITFSPGIDTGILKKMAV